jgi:hypothetical protein
MTTVSRLPALDGLDGSDALLSIHADGTTYVAPGVTVVGLSNSGSKLDLTQTIEVAIDLKSIPVNAISTLYADLIGLGTENSSRAKIQDVRLISSPILTWHNLPLPFDVNNDGVLAPIDILQLINGLRRPGFLSPSDGTLPAITTLVGPPPYYDVDNDGKLTPMDILLVINEISRRSRVEGGSVTENSLSSSWQNPLLHQDVDADGEIAPLDALLVINELRSPRIPRSNEGMLPSISSSMKPAPYVDVNGDGYLSPVDVLNIINRLNRRTGSGEGEAIIRETGFGTIAENVDAFWSEYGTE